MGAATRVSGTRRAYDPSVAERLDSREVRDWADRGRVREITTHRQAIVLHVRAARVFEGKGDSFSAGRCQDRAQRARNKLVKALVKQQLRLGAAANCGLP